MRSVNPTTEEVVETFEEFSEQQVDAALHSPDPLVALLLAFAAADGSLRDEGEDISPAGMALRFGPFCGASPAEGRDSGQQEPEDEAQDHGVPATPSEVQGERCQ